MIKRISILILALCLIATPLFAEIVRVVYRADGGVSVIYPVKEGHTIADFDEVMAESPELADMPYEDMDRSELPPTREDRNYWTRNPAGGIKIDTAKKQQDKQAKKAKKDKIKDKLSLTDTDLEELKEVLLELE